MRIIDLNEHIDEKFSEKDIDRNLALKISSDLSKYVKIEYHSFVNEPYYSILSRGYIGHIPITNDIVLRINPKVKVKNIFKMLEYAYNLRSLRFFDNTIELNTIDDIFESIASVLAKKVLDRNRKGLYRDYVNVEEPLPYLKGRLLTAKTINKMSNGSIKLECS
jgi:5-methylcytosine-specific restriction enzyme subunit McrC